MNYKFTQSGFKFESYNEEKSSPFERLFEIFKELITYTSGDFDEAIDWLKALDKEYQLTTETYTIQDFIDDLIKKGYLREAISPKGDQKLEITDKTEQAIRKKALEQIFGKLKKSASGQHETKSKGIDGEPSGYLRPYEFGDALDKISMTESIKNAQSRLGYEQLDLTEEDLVVQDNFLDFQLT